MKCSVGWVCRAGSAFILAFLTAGCTLLEPSLSPRTYAVNESADAVLNNAVLLNIVRAGYSEPLNFIAIAKYTAGGQLTASAAVGPFAAVTGAGQVYGPVSPSAQLSNSFDLNSMETKDFYQGMLQPLDPISIELWFRQGLPRALVFYTLLGSIRVSASDGVYEYKNNPTDDRWTDARTGIITPSSDKCLPQPTGRGNQTNYDVDATLWHGVHGEDCRFQKFRYFVSLAVKYGLRLETITLPDPKTPPSAAPKPTAIATPDAVKGTTPNAGTSSVPSSAAAPPAEAATKPKPKTQICYDPAVLRAINVPRHLWSAFTTCGQNKLSTRNEIALGGIGTFRDAEFVMRSGFGIFEYLGRVLATGSMESMTLGSREYDVETRNDDRLLTVLQDGGPDCFAAAWYRSSFYCVPSVGADNTKLIFTMLRAIIATNISAILLNSTPTVRVTP